MTGRSVGRSWRPGALVVAPAPEPNADQHAQRHKNQEAVDHCQERRRDAWRIGLGGGGRGNTWRQIAAPKQKALNSTRTVPTARAPLGDHTLQELLGTYTAGQRGEAGPDPGGVGTLGREHRAVGGQLGPAIGAVLRLRRHRVRSPRRGLVH